MWPLCRAALWHWHSLCEKATTTLYFCTWSPSILATNNVNRLKWLLRLAVVYMHTSHKLMRTWLLFLSFVASWKRGQSYALVVLLRLTRDPDPKEVWDPFLLKAKQAFKRQKKCVALSSSLHEIYEDRFYVCRRVCSSQWLSISRGNSKNIKKYCDMYPESIRIAKWILLTKTIRLSCLSKS